MKKTGLHENLFTIIPGLANYINVLNFSAELEDFDSVIFILNRMIIKAGEAAEIEELLGLLGLSTNNVKKNLLKALGKT